MKKNVLTPEVPRLSDDHLQQIERHGVLRTSLMQALGTSEQPPCLDEPTVSLAKIRLSAMVFGGASPKVLRYVMPALQEGLRASDDRIWVDYTRKGLPRRWVPDALTSCLIATAIIRHGDGLTATSEEILAHTRKLVGSFRDPTPAETSSPRESIWRTALAWYRHHLPCHLTAIIEGTTVVAPVPSRTIARANARLACPVSPAEAPLKEPDIFRGLLRDQKLEDLKKLLRWSLASGSTGGAAKGSEGQRGHALEVQLEELVRIENEAHAWLGIQWLRKMLRNGGLRKEKLALGTVKTYFGTYTALLKRLDGASITSLDAMALEELIHGLLLDTDGPSRRRTLMCLVEILKVGQKELGLPGIEWGAATQGLPDVEARVDANLVYPHELELAIALLEGNRSQEPVYSPMAQLAIRLMDAACLRMGEAFRLRVGDVHENFLLIRSTAHGKTKSEAGRRAIPMVGERWAAARALLDIAVDRARGLSKLPTTPIFCDSERPSWLVDRNWLERQISWALRKGTNDPAVHAHHLRHSGITRAAEALLHPGYESAQWQQGRDLRMAIVGDEMASRRAMRGLSQLAGHAGPETTLSAYVHNLEFTVAKALDATLHDIPLATLARIIGVAAAPNGEAAIEGESPAEMLSLRLRTLIRDLPPTALLSNLERAPAPDLTKKMDAPGAAAISLPAVRNALLLQRDLDLPVERIAQQTGMAESRVAAIVSEALKLRARSGIVLIEDEELARTSKGLVQTRLIESGRHHFSTYAMEQAENLEATESTARMAEALCRNFSQSRSVLSIRTWGDLVDGCGMLAAMGVLPQRIEIQAPGDLPSVREGLKESDRSLELVNVIAPKHRVDASMRKRERASGFLVRLNFERDEKARLRPMVAAAALWLIRYRAQAVGLA
ncbi:hypothetical protein GCM10028862_03240 [Luteimonas pelagia]